MDMFYGGDPNIPLTSLDGSVTACAASPIPEGYLDPSPISIDAKLVSPEGRLELQATNNNAWPESGYSETNPDPGMLSEEALLLNSTDFLSFPSFDFSNLSEHTGDGSDIPILSRDNNSNFVSDNSVDYFDQISTQPTLTVENQTFSNTKLANDKPKEKQETTDTSKASNTLISRSPTIQEAANMAVEILTSEANNITTTTTANGSTKKFRPCDSCRRRKARCIMLPSSTGRCLHCEVKKQSCTFLEAPLRRNRTKKTIMLKGSGSSTNENLGDKNTITESTTGGTDIISELTKSSGPKLKYEDYAQLGGHSLLKKALSLQYPRSSYFIGPTSVFDTRLLEATPLDSQGFAELVGDIELRKVSSDVMFSLKNDYSEELYERSIQNVDAVERLVEPHGRMLIDLYFRTIHPTFPILHKKVFIEKYKRSHREFMAPLLAAVYILALNWWNYDPALSPLPKPDVNALFKLALHTFVDALDRPKLSSVQAGILLLQCQPSHNRRWMLCSQVVALTEELGIGLDSGKWRLPRWERGLRRRLAWAVWLQDKWLSVSEARPSHIDRLRTWHIKHLTTDDFPERDENDEDGSAEVENSRLLFIEFIKLTEILEDMTDKIFTVRSVRLLTQTEKILDEIKPIQIRLRTWYQNLQPELHMTVTRPRKLCSNGYLHLAYFAAEITLHRRIIRSLTEKSSEVLITVCRSAARARLLASIDFVRNLQPEHLQAFWYSSSATNFALIGSFAALLHVTAITSEEAGFYKTQLNYYRWVLRGFAQGFEPMAAAMRLLDTALCRVPNLLDQMSISEPLVRKNGVINQSSLSGEPGVAVDKNTEADTDEHELLDEYEEGDGQEDFSNETPQYSGEYMEFCERKRHQKDEADDVTIKRPKVY